MPTEIRLLLPHETGIFSSMVDLFRDVFGMDHFAPPDIEHLGSVLADPGFIAIAALGEDGGVIGGLTAYVLRQYYSARSLLYVYDLAVAAEHQRLGTGKRLIEAINELAAVRGYEEVFVQAGREDDDAIDFYRKTRPTLEEDVLHFSYACRK